MYEIGSDRDLKKREGWRGPVKKGFGGDEWIKDVGTSADPALSFDKVKWS